MSNNAKRLFAAVDLRASSQLTSIHYVGMPPSVAGDADRRQKLPMARFLILREEREGLFLYRYDASGDTWRRDVEEALHQAEFEFGECLGEWKEISNYVEDAVKWGMSQIPSASAYLPRR